MVTASIVDGLGRGYQVKKNAEVDGKRKMIVSLYINSKGEMMTFDAIGIDAKGTSDYAKSRKQ
ncbi:MAG: hypothetical protein MJZ34_16640, partial [Paludibacteraceae bacterium]|nr:hypothetical protein [Paludibacteraceae bacterium]